MKKEVLLLMQESNKNQPIPIIVYDYDKIYLPIEETQSKVINVIEDSEGHRMILLHGGVGKGKSTLPKFMYKICGKSGEKSNVTKFDHVIMVSCGNNSISDLATKQYESLENHLPLSLTAEMAKLKEKTSSKLKTAKALKNEFSGKKILMILDNVSDKGFLSRMWDAARDGTDDKILIMSQWSNLCDNVKDDSVLIKMGDLTQEEARKILASLGKLENKQIPSHLLGIADEMIKATDRNPLALACLASHFSDNPKLRKTWLYAKNDISQLLDNVDTSSVLVKNDEDSPPRSLVGAMKLCIDFLGTPRMLRAYSI